jgi:hypothetical protein
MGGFLNLLRQGLGQQPDSAVLEHFRRLSRSREPIEIEPMQVVGADGRQFSVVERVDERSVVIGRPSGPGAHRPLIQFGAYNVLIPSPEGELAGETRVLSRVRIKAGGGRPLHCYRLTLPSSLHRVSRQRNQRLLFGGDFVCEARILAGGRSGPIFGAFEELSVDSARVRARAPVTLMRGASVHLQATLPMPVGELQVVGEVVAVEPPGRPEDGDRPVIHVKFLEPNAAIKRAISEGLERRRSA